MNDQRRIELVSAFAAERFEDIDPRLRRLVEALRARRAHEMWHKSGTFLDHLLGVYRTLALWGQPEAICRAGLFHSVYTTEFVELGLFDAARERGTVRDLIGDDAEALLFRFAFMGRRDFLRRAVDVVDTGESLGVTRWSLGGRFGREPVGLDEAAPVLVITMADLAEQWTSWQDGVLAGFPGYIERPEPAWRRTLWPGPLHPSGRNLALLSKLGACVRGSSLPTPPVFEHCTVLVDEAVAQEAFDTYERIMTGFLGGAPEAQAGLRRSMELNPHVPEPYLASAQFALMGGRYETAADLAGRGLAVLGQWGTCFDKRMRFDAFVAWARVLLGAARDRRWPDTVEGHNQLGAI